MTGSHWLSRRYRGDDKCMDHTLRYRQLLRLFVWPLVLLVLQASTAYAQDDPDTIAVVRATVVAQESPQDLEFDIWLLNIADEHWTMWANGTFQLSLPGVEMEKCSIELLPGSTDVSLVEYEIIHNTFPGRLSIALLGPDEYSLCTPVPDQDSIRIGRFRVSIPAPDILPPNLEWLSPLGKYQASAFKINADQAPFYFVNDNIDMNKGEFATLYDVDAIEGPEFEFVFFRGDYIGDRRIRLQWRTQREYQSRGFVIARGIRLIGEIDNSNVEFEDTVACYSAYPGADPRCQRPALNSPGLSLVPRDYRTVDTVDFREEEYVYRLWYHHFDGNLIHLADTVVYVPSSVIAFAQASPNPFTEKTTIQYLLDDRVILTAKVFDVTGREVAVLIDGVETPAGDYEIEFVASRLASQGLYTVRFTAYPIDDPNVVISTADVKLQLVR